MRRIDHKIAYLLILIVFLGTGSAFAAKYVLEAKNDAAKVKNQVVEEIVPSVTESLISAADEAIKEQITKEPPKHITKQTVTTTPSNGGQVTTVSNGTISPGDSNEYLSNCQSSSTPLGIGVTDKTGRYLALGTILDEYLNGLRWGGEISSLCRIYVMDAGKTGWSGQYIASYQANYNGDIVSATGAIILNASYYSQLDQSTFNEYMKLILSHEYGHHYTQYHKWVDLDLPVGVRFPDAYYSVRPLSKSATTVDCSSNWETCESEIIAEDYSYLYSGYGLHQISNLYGYPSSATRTWLDGLTSAESPTPEPEQPAQNQNQNSANNNQNVNSNENSNVNTNTNSGSGDTTNPVVIIIDPSTNPFDWGASLQNLDIKIRATDDVGVTNIKVYINDQFQGERAATGVNLTWDYSTAPAGVYSLKAEAYDAAGNIGEIILTINKS